MSNSNTEQEPIHERLNTLRIRKIRINDASKMGFRISSPNFNATNEGIQHDLENIRDRRIENTGPSPRLTWIHIPGNDRTLCEYVIRMVSETELAYELLDDHCWSGLLRGSPSSTSFVETPFMDATAFCFTQQDGSWTMNDKVDNKEDLISRVIYAPYLHWDNLDDFTSARKTHCDPSIHPRRSLDETYNFLSQTQLDARNKTQVVNRAYQNPKGSHILPSPGPAPLMVVDQLWMWIIDEKLLITSFPDSPGSVESCEVEHKAGRKCRLLHLECLIIEQIGRTPRRPGGLTARSVSGYVMHRISKVFMYHSHAEKESLRFIDKFKKSISEQRAKSTALFEGLFPENRHAYLSPHLRPQLNAINDISGDVDAIHTVRDIIEELHIMLHVYEQQVSALRLLQHPGWETLRGATKSCTDELSKLSQQAIDIHDFLFKTLELKQTLLSARQNQIMIVFTIITIIFLPLSFLSSIFGMNARELSDGGGVGLGITFAYMFPISAVIWTVALYLAFSPSKRAKIKHAVPRMVQVRGREVAKMDDVSV